MPFFACSPFADERENRFRQNSTDCDKEKHRAKMGRRGAAGRVAGKKERPPEGQEGERAARSKLGGFGAFQLQLELVRDEGDEF